jgi:hypothetical protein
MHALEAVEGVHHGKAQSGWAPGGKKKKVLPKSSFRQRYVEAERRRAGACSDLRD